MRLHPINVAVPKMAAAPLATSFDFTGEDKMSGLLSPLTIPVTETQSCFYFEA